MAEKQSNKERLKDITDSIEQGIKEMFNSDKYKQYLSTMSRFHKYSVNNQVLIYMQRPDATLVAGFNKWRENFGRNVMKGEKGIKIIAPTPFKKKIEEQKLDPDTKLPMLDADGKVITEEKEIKIPMYKPVVVFDVSQTDGKPLPELASTLTGEVQNYEVFMEALKRSAPVPLAFEAMAADMDGYFSRDEQRIAIREGMSEVQTVCAADANERFFDRSLWHGSYDEAPTWLASVLEDDVREVIINETARFAEAYSEDRSLMRFRMYSPEKILAELNEIELPRREYRSEMREIPAVSHFITEDEISVSLIRGGNVDGTKGRIFGYFQDKHTVQEQAAFLRNEYGIGGSSHAVSGTTYSGINYDGKGISLKKPDCPEVQLNWTNVAKRVDKLIKQDRYLTPEEKAQFDVLQRQNSERNRGYSDYNAVKEAHPDSIVLYQVGDFFEMYGEDAKIAAPLLDIHLSTRSISDVGRVEMCGVPAHTLEQYVEKLRESHDVTISAVDHNTNERKTYTMLSIDNEAMRDINAHEAEFGTDGTRAFTPTAEPTQNATAPDKSAEITQDEIDDALRLWNGDMESKRAVVRYMEDHARDRDTAAWLANEYGSDSFIVHDGSPESLEMPWAKIQRRIAQLIQADNFYTEAERDNFDDIDSVAIREALAERGIENGEVTNPEALDRDPFIRQVMNDTEQSVKMDARDRFSIRLHPNEGGITGIWDAALNRFYEEGNQVLRFAEQDNAIDYLADIQRTHGMELSEAIFTTPTGKAYRIGDGVSSLETEHKETTIIIEDVTEDDIWYVLPSVPEQDAVNINRNSFERYLDTSFFSVVDIKQPIQEIHDEKMSDEQSTEQSELITESVAFYSGKENDLPFDVEIQTIRTIDPESQINRAANYRITDENLGAGCSKVKFRMNLYAIYTLKMLENQHRQATPRATGSPLPIRRLGRSCRCF